MPPRLALLLLACTVAPSPARQLPMVVYSARDGFPTAAVLRLLPDSNGFVWIPHLDGLTRYDGNNFRTLTAADGLPTGNVADIIESPNHTYWVAVRDRLCLLDPRAPKSTRFTCESPNLGDISALLEANGRLWCGTDRGLFYRRPGQPFTPAIQPANTPLTVRRLLQDKRRDVWAATYSGVFRIRSDGHTDRWTTAEGLGDNYMTTISETPEAIWAGTQTHLFRFDINTSGQARIAARYGTAEGLPSGFTNDIRYWRGTVWAATFQGLARLLPNGRWQPIEVDPKLRGLPIDALTVDSQDALWIVAEGGGAARIASSGFTTLSESDGLDLRKIWSILEDPQGNLNVVTKDETRYAVNRYDGNQFHPTRLTNPRGAMFGWSWSQIAIASPRGPWWIATSDGLLRYDHGLNAAPVSLAGNAGIIHRNITRVFEQSNGAIWASVYQLDNESLYRLDPGASRFRRFTQADGLPRSSVQGSPVSYFLEDPHGQLWIGRLRSGLLRYRNGQFESFAGRVPNAPVQGVRSMLLDRHGRLWIATMGEGLLRVDDLKAENPTFFPYTTADGLASNVINSIVEDREGRIYAAGASTIDRLDPNRPPGSQVRHYTTADGVLPGVIRVAFKDRHGDLWFGGDQGLCHLQSIPDPQIEISIRFHSIRVNGQPQHLSLLGELQPAALHLQSFERQLEVEFGAFRDGLLYQTRLQGLDPDWTAPTRSRNVHYASLAPGSYELLIRALSPDGTQHSQLSRLRFSIVAPLWQRTWFLALIGSLLAALTYAFHLLAVERRIAIERLRARIATDLHDDIGASLSRIAVMSEALQIRQPQPDWHQTLGQIAEESRAMLRDMSDIVWSIDPRRDTMAELVARLRAFGSDLLEPQGIRWTFDAPEAILNHRLSPDQRRHFYLILKEAIHNIARHSQAATAAVSIRLEKGALFVDIEDDGKGYTPNHHRLGIHSMETRTRRLSGAFTVSTRPEGGTRVSLRVPLGPKNA